MEEKRMKKKIVSALLCATMVVTLVSGCGSAKEENKEEPVKQV